MNEEYIYFDIETTDLPLSSEIIQIGAVDQNGATFNTFIIPKGEISESATKVHGIEKINGSLHKNGQPIQEAVQPSVGLKNFLNWIDGDKKKGRKRKILIGHNAHCFDAPILINNIRNCNVENFSQICKIIRGFGDTLKSFRKLLHQGPYKQECLMGRFGVGNGQSHDALKDAQDLKELVRLAAVYFQMSPEEFVTRSVIVTRKISLE